MTKNSHNLMTAKKALGNTFTHILQKLEGKVGTNGKPLTKNKDILLHQPYELRCPLGNYVLKLDMQLNIFSNRYDEKHFSVMVNILGYSKDWDNYFTLPTTAQLNEERYFLRLPEIKLARWSKSMKNFKKKSPVDRLIDDFDNAYSSGELDRMISHLVQRSESAFCKEQSVSLMKSHGFELKPSGWGEFTLNPYISVKPEGDDITISCNKIKLTPKVLEALKVIQDATDTP